MEVVKILDVAVGENGPTQSISDRFLRIDQPLRLHCKLGTGDTVLIQGRISESHDWDILHTFTDETPADVYLSKQVRAIRSVDGGDSPAVAAVYAQNPYLELELTTHT